MSPALIPSSFLFFPLGEHGHPGPRCSMSVVFQIACVLGAARKFARNTVPGRLGHADDAGPCLTLNPPHPMPFCFCSSRLLPSALCQLWYLLPAAPSSRTTTARLGSMPLRGRMSALIRGITAAEAQGQHAYSTASFLGTGRGPILFTFCTPVPSMAPGTCLESY